MNNKISIPSIEECYNLMNQYKMLPNIKEHSIQVMNVSTAIIDNLKHDVKINKKLVIAAALLHDITKTRSLQTKEHHDITGKELLNELGFHKVGQIISEHVTINNFNQNDALHEKEIIFYADKRVMHDQIVSIDERIADLIVRYGQKEENKIKILNSKKLITGVENKIKKFLNNDLEEIISKIHE